MNINEYISSGILEQYVSGTASAQERQEVECMSHIYPEIHTELIAVQDALEAFAQAQAIAPPAHLRQNIFDAIANIEKENAASHLSVSTNNIVEKNNEPIAEKPTELSFTKRNNFKSAAAILFLVSSGLGYLLYNENNKASSFENDLAVVKSEIQNQKNIIANKTEQLAIVQNKDFTPITMAGIPTKSPESNAVIYWNKTSQEVFVSVNLLPTPAKGKQYQLWAIADGKPVDLGMISNDKELKLAFQKMKTIKNPSAFAVTLEVEGGVPSPTMSEMYVMGGV
jgi:anti-sigma-K factor RskA